MTDIFYDLQIQQLHSTIDRLSKMFGKTPHQIWYDILEYHGKLRNTVKSSTQTDINFFLELSKRAIEFKVKSEYIGKLDDKGVFQK